MSTDIKKNYSSLWNEQRRVRLCLSRTILFTLMMLFFPSEVFSETLYLDVGEERFIGVPDVAVGVVDHAIWSCDNGNVVFVEKDDAGAIIKIQSYFKEAAVITLVYVVKYYDSKGFTRSYTGIKYYNVQCKGSAPEIVPSVLTLKVGETYQLHISPSSYESNAVWSDWDPTTARVSSSGVVTARKKGTGIIFATISGQSSPLTCTVNVKETTMQLSCNVMSGEIDKGTEVSLTSGKSNAIIYYTLDGSSPVENGEVYTDPLVISENVSLRAIAYDMDEELEPSAVLSRDFNIKKLVLTSNVDDNIIEAGSRVSLLSNYSDANIYYTLDGSTPSINSILYTDPVTIEENTIMNAIACGDKYIESEILSLNLVATSLKIEKKYPDNSESINQGHAILYTKFNDTVGKSINFDRIELKYEGSNLVQGTVVFDKDILYYVPNQALVDGTYEFTIPSAAVVTNDGNVNTKLITEFKINASSKDVLKVATGDHISGMVTNNGELWTWGEQDELGIGLSGSSLYKTEPQYVMDDVADYSAGGSHSLAIDEDGNLWSWGWNYYGQLGDGSNKMQYSPVYICKGKIVSATDNLSLMIDENESLWAWGYNSYGGIGDGTTTKRSEPVKIKDGITKACTGGYHTLAIDKDGGLWAWGSNTHGEVSNSSTSQILSPIKIMENIKSVAAGNAHSMALDNDGKVWTWGWNAHGNLGDGTTTDRKAPSVILDDVKQIYAGVSQGYAIKNDNSLWAWGYNGNGAIGDGTTNNCLYPKKIMENIKDLSACRHVLAIDIQGNIWAWGNNSHGQVGDGTTENQLLPRLIRASSHAPSLENMSIDSMPYNVKIGESKLILPLFSPVNAEYEDMEWTSNNEAVAIVSNRGIVTGVALGEAELTVKVTSGEGTVFISTCSVTVTDEGEVTSLREIRNEELGIKNAVLFNLNGQQVTTPKHGIFIRAGRKVVVK